VFWGPSAVGFEKGIGDDDQSAHGGQGAPSWFSSTDEAEIFSPQVRIEASGEEDSHRERLTQAGATTSNEGAPCPELTPDRRARDKAYGLTHFERGVQAFQSVGEGDDLGCAGSAGAVIAEARVSFHNLFERR
jgi:hypothetical protein